MPRTLLLPNAAGWDAVVGVEGLDVAREEVAAEKVVKGDVSP